MIAQNAKLKFLTLSQADENIACPWKHPVLHKELQTTFPRHSEAADLLILTSLQVWHKPGRKSGLFFSFNSIVMNF